MSVNDTGVNKNIVFNEKQLQYYLLVRQGKYTV